MFQRFQNDGIWFNALDKSLTIVAFVENQAYGVTQLSVCVSVIDLHDELSEARFDSECWKGELYPFFNFGDIFDIFEIMLGHLGVDFGIFLEFSLQNDILKWNILGFFLGRKVLKYLPSQPW